MRVILIVSILLSASLLSGCATQVHQDYQQYLANNEGRVTYPNVGRSAQYYLDQATSNHSVKIESWMAGIANSWTVQFGEVLDATMKARDMQSSFKSLSKANKSNDTDELMLLFHLRKYQFENFSASIDMTIAAQSNNHEFLSKQYSAQGRSQGGKMFWGGAFAMKNAIQQSTKLALDKILTSFLNDLNTALKASTSESESGTGSYSKALAPRAGEQWRGGGPADACGKAWKVELQTDGKKVTGTLWRDGIEYEVLGRLNFSEKTNTARAAKKIQFSHVPGPRFLKLQLSFQGAEVRGLYGIDASSNLECVSRISLTRF